LQEGVGWDGQEKKPKRNGSMAKIGFCRKGREGDMRKKKREIPGSSTLNDKPSVIKIHGV